MLRLQLYKDRVKKSGGNVTLRAFYIFCRPDERVQNLVAFKTKKDAEVAIKAFEEAAKAKVEAAKQKEAAEKAKKQVDAQKKIYENVFGKD